MMKAQGASFQIKKPFNFSLKNHFPIASQQALLKRIIFPETYQTEKQFKLGQEKRNFLLRAMGATPKELGYNSPEYYDSYGKFFMYGHTQEKNQYQNTKYLRRPFRSSVVQPPCRTAKISTTVHSDLPQKRHATSWPPQERTREGEKLKHSSRLPLSRGIPPLRFHPSCPLLAKLKKEAHGKLPCDRRAGKMSLY